MGFFSLLGNNEMELRYLNTKGKYGILLLSTVGPRAI